MLAVKGAIAVTPMKMPAIMLLLPVGPGPNPDWDLHLLHGRRPLVVAGVEVRSDANAGAWAVVHQYLGASPVVNCAHTIIEN